MKFLHLIFFTLPLMLTAQTNFVTGPTGFWEGYLIRNGNSVQQFYVVFEEKGDSVQASFSIPEWLYYSSVESTVQMDDDVLSFDSYFGNITMVQDSAYAEMIGECGFANVHMKKALRRPTREVKQIELAFDLGDIQTKGQCFHPKEGGPFPTVILVHGRGCGEAEDLKQRIFTLLEFGLAVVVYDKRGSEPTGFPCEEVSMELLTTDLVKITEKVSAQRFSDEVGYLSYSAGGWLAPRAAAQSSVEVAFIATIAGPSTSVKQQQIDCGNYYCREILGLSEPVIDDVIEYTELMFSDDSPKAVYKRMDALLEQGEKDGWLDVLEDDDIPSSAANLDAIWVRRNRYEPAEDLKAFKGPFLSVLGGSDFVVPWKENSQRFHQLFAEAGKTNYRVSVLPSAGHGMEHGNKVRDMGYYPELGKWYTYFKFDRVAPGAVDEFIAFLREYKFIP